MAVSARDRVYLGMSGGVDSTAAAWILRNQGRPVEGVTFLAYNQPEGNRGGTPEEVEAAAEVCRFLGIPHHVADWRQEFRQRVIEPFIREYRRGRTPNPCMLCNRVFKFGLMAEWAARRGGGNSGIATGHYVRVKRDSRGRLRIARGKDLRKDQSYFLGMVRPDILPRLVFPLADWDKAQARELIRREGLPLASGKRESQDICFAGGDYRDFLRSEGVEAPPGELVMDGRTVGQHGGIPFYSCGQRRGLGVAAGRRVYVREIRSGENRIFLGERPRVQRFTVDQLNSFAELDNTAQVQIRYRSRPLLIDSLSEEGETLEVTLREPCSLLSPGQYAVFYRDGMAAAGGVIRQTELLPEGV